MTIKATKDGIPVTIEMDWEALAVFLDNPLHQEQMANEAEVLELRLEAWLRGGYNINPAESLLLYLKSQGWQITEVDNPQKDTTTYPDSTVF